MIKRREVLCAGLNLGAVLGLPSLQQRSETGTIAPFTRSARAQALRVAAAQAHADTTQPAGSNGDDERYASRLASFTKTLPHNEVGEVDPKAYDALLRAIRSGRATDFESVPIGGVIRLTNPQASTTFALEGPDSHEIGIDSAPPFASDEAAAEACELYWQALTRDVPFAQYSEHPMIAGAVVDLSRLSVVSRWYPQGLTADRIFRGLTKGDTTGPFISQFLWKEVPFGAIRLVPHVRTATAGFDYLTQYDGWLAVQNGAATSSRHANAYRYIRTARDLAAYLELDFTYQAFLTACLVLFGMEGTTDVRRPYKGAPWDSANPYRQSKNQSGFVTFGVGHVLDLVARVATAALHATWYHKWLVHRRLRPEEYGGRLHNHLTKRASYPLHAAILESAGVEEVRRKHGTHLLPQAYPEGSPMHPAYPAGHAAIAGACVTVMKAFFEESFSIDEPVLPRPDGLSLEPYKGPLLTVGGELDKLASNMSVGRNMAGVHWRSDAVAGLMLGEEVAISMLKEVKPCFSEGAISLSLTRFDGSRIAV